MGAVSVGCGDDGTTPAADGSGTETDGAMPTGGGSMETGSTGSIGDAESGDANDTDRPPGIEAARMILEPLVAAQCERAFSCCNADEVAWELGSAIASAQECTSRTLDVLESGGNPPFFEGSVLYLGNILPFFAYGVDANEVVPDEDAIAACVTALAEQPCAAVAEPGAENCVPPPAVAALECDLAQMFVGQREAGEPCSSYNGLECGPGLVCDFYGGGGGVCVASLTTGDDCFNDHDCAGELICDYASGECTQPADFGEPCAYATPDNPAFGTETTRCREDLACDPISETCLARICNFGSFCDIDAECPEGLSCVTNRCDFLALPGEYCWDDDDCTTDNCLFSGFDPVCAELAGVGDGCNDHRNCESGYCDPSSTQCAAPTPLGQPCDPGLPTEQCDGGYCDADVCAAFLEIDDDCSSGGLCNFLDNEQCWDGTCQPYPLPVGQTCTESYECETGVCDGVCQPPADVGADCSIGGCGDALYCDIDAGETQGTCQERGTRGAPCNVDIECWGSCEARFGETRCSGNGPQHGYCDGV